MRRRKSKYIWLPGLGSPEITDIPESADNGFSFSCSAQDRGAIATSAFALFPILEDTPQEVTSTQENVPNIVDFIGTDYVIKRIVGKVFLEALQVAADTPPTAIVTAGFFVARAEDANPVVPIEANNTTQAVSNYDPNFVDNIREPWIWRRSWMLSNTGSTNASTNAFRTNRSNNMEYGSIQDGPHIDAKTGRRVRNDERLWFACSARIPTTDSAELTNDPAISIVVNGYLDVRVLGALRRARNKSNF